MPNPWESLRVNFIFEVVEDEARIMCVNCDDNAQATNPDQVIKWAKRHLDNCSGLVPESDPSELEFFNPDVYAYEAKEILSDED
jgi:hypothetical protein